MSTYTLGIDIGSTTVKIAVLDENDTLLFADYERHFANIQETLAGLLQKAYDRLGELTLHPVIDRFWRTYTSQSPGDPFCPGGDRRIKLSSENRASDRRSH